MYRELSMAWCLLMTPSQALSQKRHYRCIFVARQMQEKCLAVNKRIYTAFLALEKAFNCVPRILLLWELTKLCYPVSQHQCAKPCLLFFVNLCVAVRLSLWIITMFCKGSWVQSSARSTFFLPFFSRFSLIPSQSASLYIIASFEVYLIAENNWPHVLVVLFQKTVQYILTPIIFDMPPLYSIISLKM